MAQSRRRSSSNASTFRRSHAVWLSLLGAMTAVGGLLLVLEDRPGTPPGAFASSPATGNRSSADLGVIFQTREPILSGRWDGIVIHHSGAAVGSPETIASQHEGKGLKGLGYHFVISNGNGAADGQIHVGYRWDYQLAGAHTGGPKGDYYNRRTIGICLVGDGERRQFTDAQLERLVDLVSDLQKQLNIPSDKVVLHRDVAETSSPGRLFPEAAFRARLKAAR